MSKHTQITNNFLTIKSFIMYKPLTILLAEHDKELASITKNYLVSCGYSTILCSDGEETLQIFKKEQLDFVLLDINIPNVNGYDLVSEMRKKSRDLPIVFIGSDTHQTEIVKAFRIGADDFISRPLSMEELGLRIEAIYKRAKNNEKRQHIYTFGSYKLDTLNHVLIHDGNEKKLTTKEVALLSLFCEYKNRVVERSVALKRIWHIENYFNARNMDVYIGRLRNMLCDDPNVQLENVHGIGYRLSVTI